MLIIPREPFQYIEKFHVLNDVLQINDILYPHVPSVGAEIGVRFGITSHFLLSENPTLQMHLVDAYEPYQRQEEHYTKEKQDAIYFQARRRLDPYGPRAVWRKTSSESAAQGSEDGFFDFVFLNAHHNYDDAVDDLMTWLPKVRRGGVLCGHDYDMDGVRQAVDEIASTQVCPVQEVGWPAHVWFLEIL